MHVRGNQVSVWAHPAPLHTITNKEAWTPEALAEIWDYSLGQSKLRRLERMGIPFPPSEEA